MKRSFADILQGLDDNRAAKVARKLPSWAGAEIPSALSLEQCSSEATAGYKASLAGRSDAFTPCTPFQGDITLTGGIVRGGTASAAQWWGPTKEDVSGGSWPLRGANTVLDLTGGLGVDSWAFSQVAERVVYFERSEELAEAAKRNFARLGAANIEVRCETVTPESELPEADLIYVDPARRNASGRKVFLLEDCTPDILTLLPMLLRKAPTVLLKLSPMADLAMLADRLGPALREIHVVELDGEVKELLCLLCGQSSSHPLHPLKGDGTQNAIARVHHRTTSGEPTIIIVRLSGQAATAPEGRLRFRLSEERESEARYAAEVRAGDTLLEPCAALLKAGAFRLPCARWGLLKLAPSTHLYLLPFAPGTETSYFAPGGQENDIPGAKIGSGAPGNPFFKAHRICDVLPFGAAAFKELRRRYPKADVTARNLPLGSAELQKKIGVAPGGDAHIYACRLADATAVLIVCSQTL